MPKSVKFRSIYYRFVLFIVILYLLGAHQIVGRGIQTVTIFDYVFNFHQTQLGYSFVLLIFVGIGINFLFPWKFYITQDGIYIRRLDLFVPWSDISGVSHVWINKASNFSRGLAFYNNKCLVFYRNNYKPICIYNTSLLALFLVKLFNSQIKTNILSASFATGFNILLNNDYQCCGRPYYFRQHRCHQRQPVIFGGNPGRQQYQRNQPTQQPSC